MGRLVPYTKEALKTYNKIFDKCIPNPYIVNQPYRWNDTRRVYINSKGFMHIIEQGKKWTVDFLLTTDNMLREVSRGYTRREN